MWTKHVRLSCGIFEYYLHALVSGEECLRSFSVQFVLSEPLRRVLHKKDQHAYLGSSCFRLWDTWRRLLCWSSHSSMWKLLTICWNSSNRRSFPCRMECKSVSFRSCKRSGTLKVLPRWTFHLPSPFVCFWVHFKIKKLRHACAMQQMIWPTGLLWRKTLTWFLTLMALLQVNRAMGTQKTARRCSVLVSTCVLRRFFSSWPIRRLCVTWRPLT